MTLGTSPELNEVVAFKILARLKEVLGDERYDLGYLHRNFGQEVPTTQGEIDQVVRWAVQSGFLTASDTSINETTTISNIDHAPAISATSVELAVSIPKHTELGLGESALRNDLVETREAFTDIIGEARKHLRICSPFLERNVLDPDGIPDLLDQIMLLFERGARLTVLGRFINRNHGIDRTYHEWLVEHAADLGYSKRLSIFNYHHFSGQRVISSTHAKMLIADDAVAYLGSGEIRRNSLAHNFEIGCIIRGPRVPGLSEVFDLMCKYGDRVF